MGPRVALVALALCLALAGGCAVAPSGGDRGDDLPGGKADDPSEGSDGAPAMPLEIHWVRNSAEYRAAVAQAYALATVRAEGLAEGREGGSWAVVLDVDETVLDNSTYQAERAALGRGYSWQSWRAWVNRREATPLPGVVAFLSRVRELGGRVALVTNRSEVECPPTEENLEAEGVPYDVMLCRTGESDKAPRWEMIEEGTASESLPPLDIALWVGDNIQDFPGLDQGLRLEGDEALAGFGDRYIVIPNPMYGSWVDNPRD